MRRFKLIGACLVSSMLPLMSGIYVARAQEYPSKTIRLVVQSPTGGGTDLFARVLGRKLTESWRQSVFIDNRPGAGGIVGTEIVARAAPDGYTLLMIPSTHAINPGLYKTLPYDPINDFAAVGLVATSLNILVVHPSLPVRSVAQLIALARKRPGELTFASAGVGSTTHLAGELFRRMAKINVVHVPYKGSGPAEIELAGGQVQYMIDSLPAGLPNVRSGKTRALATTGKKRFPALPEVPTVAESGLPGYESNVWWGVLAPSGTPKPVISKLNKEIVRIMALPDVKELVLNQGAESRTGSPQEFMDFIKTETNLYSKIIAEAGIKTE